MEEATIRNILIEIMGVENFELKVANDYYILILHYSVINIINEFDENHQIKGLYIKISGYKNDRKDFQGIRGTLSYAEYISGYSHSHLNSFSFSNFNHFCLGTSELQMLLHEDIFQSEEYLKYFCIVLENYLSWESIEGTPYIRLSTINPFGSLSNISIYDTYIDSFKPKVDKLDVNINFNIKNIEEIEDNLYNFGKNSNSHKNQGIFCNKVENTYYSNQSNMNVDSYQNRLLFTFNDKEIRLKIEDKIQINNDKIKKTIHPKITQEWCNRTTQNIRNHYIKSNRITQTCS